MATVAEDIMIVESDKPIRSIERDETLLLSPPHPNKMPIKLWHDHEPLSVVTYGQQYEARPFAPPRGVYENAQVRIEWQTMDNRQPFYHRNCDVDEISYQIDGDRTLMTELGVVEHRPGEFSRIPRGVAHDNYGRRESHLLFYIPAPVAEVADPVRLSEAVMPPFEGWQAGPWNEAITQCMGTVGHDIAVFPVDEQQLLDRVHQESERLTVLRGSTTAGTTWMYASPGVRLGTVTTPPVGQGVRRYTRTLDADEIQYQISGTRTLFTQRGVVEMQPGDFVRIPLGISHGSVARDTSTHLSLLSHLELPQVAETTRVADLFTPELLATAVGENR